MKITDLILDEHNANLGTERGKEMLAQSLKEYGAGRSILVDKEGRVIAGNKTLAQAIEAGIEDLLVVETDGSQLVAVKRLDLDLNDGDRARELAYADNRTSEIGLDWNPDQLLADLEGGLDLSGLFGKDELDELLAGLVEEPADTEEEARRTLTERFVVPPFSVLDARQGYWQERKRAWIALGIQGELGRGMMEQSGNYRSDYGDYQPNFGAGKLERE